MYTIWMDIRHAQGDYMIRDMLPLNYARMALAFVAACAIILFFAGSSPASAACSNNKALGVSRVIEIDADGGPKYGSQQYKKHDFLKNKEVVLTFDDGPTRIYTTPILKALREACTKATFFMVGQMARAYPSMVRMVAAEGHTVATHTWSHQNLAKRSRKRDIKEIELAISVITKILGKPPAPFFRFPYLSDPKRMIKYLQKRDISVFSIDVDSKDYLTRNGSTVTRRILRGLKRRGKGILLFHDIQKSTARALPGLLRKLKQQGYKVVHLRAKSKVVTNKDYDVSAARLIKHKDDTTDETGTRKHRASTEIKARKTVKSSRKRRKVKYVHRRSRKHRKTTRTLKSQSWTKQISQNNS